MPKYDPPPLTYQQLVALLELWESEQVAAIDFDLPSPFKEP